ncbi:hypothetical protein [Marinimicrobium sp. C2-29]|uniref:hypothetical protein n=1 Tax=Marinimicrobium sp. C2-29 TaxID=3139825 RepID=UPI003139E69A
MIPTGMHYRNKSKSIIYRVCHVWLEGSWCAVADMTKALNATHIAKPRAWKIQEFLDHIHSEKLIRDDALELPIEITMSDDQLRMNNRSKWLDKRDHKLSLISTLTSDEIIRKYLYGYGIAPEIKELCEKTLIVRSAYYSALNRYITMGQTDNALLPFKLRHCGSNYKIFSDTDSPVSKRGRGGNNNENSLSKSRGITLLDKDRISSLLNEYMRMFGRPTMRSLIDYFNACHQMVEIQSSDPNTPSVYREPLPENERLSERQIEYHIRKIIGVETILRRRVGEITYAKDFSQKPGSARDGVVGPTHRYEIDSTTINVYVISPYTGEILRTIGRPTIYIVVDVWTTLFAGVYISLTGTEQAAFAEALYNAMMPKVPFAARFGIEIEDHEWPAHHRPHQLVMDNGSENSPKYAESVLRAGSNIETGSWTPAYRGDCKAIVERALGLLTPNVNRLPGSVTPDTPKEGEHPANGAMFTMDDLYRSLIREMLGANSTKDRIKSRDFDMAAHSTGSTPNDQFIFGVERRMNGGYPVETEEQLKQVRWSVLPEERARVTENCVVFRGLRYHHPYAEEQNWYTTASRNGRFDIIVRVTQSSTDCIFYRTDEGQVLSFKLQDTDEQYLNQHWDIVIDQLENEKQIIHDNKIRKANVRAKNMAEDADTIRRTKSSMRKNPDRNKSIPRDVKSQKSLHAEINKRVHDAEIAKQLSDGGVALDPATEIKENSIEEAYNNYEQ